MSTSISLLITKNASRKCIIYELYAAKLDASGRGEARLKEIMRQSPTNEKPLIVEVKVTGVEKRKETKKNYVSTDLFV